MRARAGEQRQEQRAQGEHAPGHAHAVPARRIVVQQPVWIAGAGQAEAEREHGTRDRADQQPGT